jgi:hypothetical protein
VAVLLATTGPVHRQLLLSLKAVLAMTAVLLAADGLVAPYAAPASAALTTPMYD